MGVFYLRLCLLALLQAVAITSASAPGVVEVDLIFPRNETYAPVDIMPIVFAIQNPHSAALLDLNLQYDIWLLDALHGNQSHPKNVPGLGISDLDYMHFLRSSNLSSSKPYLRHYGTDLINTEGTWIMEWDLGAANCSESPQNGVRTGGHVRNHYVIFTIKKGGQQPNLVAATDNGVCENTPGYAFNITETLPVPPSATDWQGQPSCAVLSPASPLPSLNPCAAKIVPSAASSISAALTASACSYPDPGVKCPSPTPQNAAPGPVQSSVGGTAWLAAFFSWLAFVVA